MKDWTKTSATKCSVCDSPNQLVLARGFMVCPEHLNPITLSDCEALRQAQKALDLCKEKKK